MPIPGEEDFARLFQMAFNSVNTPHTSVHKLPFEVATLQDYLFKVPSRKPEQRIKYLTKFISSMELGMFRHRDTVSSQSYGYFAAAANAYNALADAYDRIGDPRAEAAAAQAIHLAEKIPDYEAALSALTAMARIQRSRGRTDAADFFDMKAVAYVGSEGASGMLLVTLSNLADWWARSDERRRDAIAIYELVAIVTGDHMGALLRAADLMNALGEENRLRSWIAAANNEPITLWDLGRSAAANFSRGDIDSSQACAIRGRDLAIEIEEETWRYDFEKFLEKRIGVLKS